jgi:hypothetical protein
MGVYANQTNEKLIITSDPIVINGVTYDPKTHKEDIKGFKWFKKKWMAEEYYDKLNGEQELYIATLSNNKKAYVVAFDENEARDKIYKWVKKRFFGGSMVNISNIEHLAETKTKGFVPKLIM